MYAWKSNKPNGNLDSPNSSNDCTDYNNYCSNTNKNANRNVNTKRTDTKNEILNIDSKVNGIIKPPAPPPPQPLQKPTPPLTSSPTTTSSSSSTLPQNNSDRHLHQPHHQQKRTIKCRNSLCNLVTSMEEGEKTFKTCHHCYTYYCSKTCRSQHWSRHKEKCLHSKLNSLCKQLLRKIHNSEKLTNQLSKFAYTGLLLNGKGCLVIIFQSHIQAEEFIKGGKITENENKKKDDDDDDKEGGHDDCDATVVDNLRKSITYASLNDLKNVEIEDRNYLNKLIEAVATYNPDLKYIVDIEIGIGDETLSQLASSSRVRLRNDHTKIIRQFIKLRLTDDFTKRNINKNNHNHNHNNNNNNNNKNYKVQLYQPLILTGISTKEMSKENACQLTKRRMFFANVLSKLLERGVVLEKAFPNVYKALCDYVSDDIHLGPISIYPLDTRTGVVFMCFIMPDSDESDWIGDVSLKELGL